MVISFMPWVIAGAIIAAVIMGAGVLAFNTVVGTRILKKYPEFLILKHGQKGGKLHSFKLFMVGRCKLIPC